MLDGLMRRANSLIELKSLLPKVFLDKGSKLMEKPFRIVSDASRADANGQAFVKVAFEAVQWSFGSEVVGMGGSAYVFLGHNQGFKLRLYTYYSQKTKGPLMQTPRYRIRSFRSDRYVLAPLRFTFLHS